MKTRYTFMVCAASMLGFLLGTLFTHQTTVKAQSGMEVYVVKRSASDWEKNGPAVIPGGQIVGFSCVRFGDYKTDCVTAYTK